MSAVLCGRGVTEGNDLIGGLGPFESPGKTTSPNMPVHAHSAPASHPASAIIPLIKCDDLRFEMTSLRFISHNQSPLSSETAILVKRVRLEAAHARLPASIVGVAPDAIQRTARPAR